MNKNPVSAFSYQWIHMPGYFPPVPCHRAGFPRPAARFPVPVKSFTFMKIPSHQTGKNRSKLEKNGQNHEKMTKTKKNCSKLEKNGRNREKSLKTGKNYPKPGKIAQNWKKMTGTGKNRSKPGKTGQVIKK